MCDGNFRSGIKAKIAKMRMGIEATKVRLAQFHQDLIGGHPLTGVLEIDGAGDGVIERTSGASPGSTCSISNMGRGPPAMIGRTHASTCPSPSPKFTSFGSHIPRSSSPDGTKSRAFTQFDLNPKKKPAESLDRVSYLAPQRTLEPRTRWLIPPAAGLGRLSLHEKTRNAAFLNFFL